MNKKEIIETDQAPPAIGAYSQATKYNGCVYVSGQLPMDSAGNLVEGTVAEKTHAVMKNIRAILKQAGSSFDNVLKARVYVDDLGNFEEVNKVYGKYFSDNPPSRAFVQVVRLPKNAPLEIEVVAAV